MNYTLFLIALIPNLLPLKEKTISKNNMNIHWHFENDRVHFKINAPTSGWIAIGFNPNKGIKGSYLLMARVKNGKAEVVEHYTLSPGNYKSLESLGEKDLVENVKGEELKNFSEVEFSLPINSKTKYRYKLNPGMDYNLIMAFSRDDDFKHHSMMRTSTQIKL